MCAIHDNKGVTIEQENEGQESTLCLCAVILFCSSPFHLREMNIELGILLQIGLN